MKIALYQPDIPQNTGTILRLAACLGIAVDIIEPCGFVWNDRKLKRSGMDYLDQVNLTRHNSWEAFQAAQSPSHRLVLLSTKAEMAYTDFTFTPDDILLMGRESAGVPDAVHQSADARLIIPMRPELRSINVAICAAMVVGEALRQTGGFYHDITAG